MISRRTRCGTLVRSTSLFIASFLLSGLANAAPSITVSPGSGPPTSRILVSGSGFGTNAQVDIFFDTRDEAVVLTDGSGEFHDASLYAPRSAYPGRHWITARERANGQGSQNPFLVQTNWSQARFSPDLIGVNPYENVLNSKTAGGLALKWSFSSGGYSVYSSASVVNGVVYIGMVNYFVDALKASTGNLIWSSPTKGRVLSDPAVVNGIVYATSEGGDLDALWSGNGQDLWTYTAGLYGDGSPTLVDNVVYVGSGGGNLYAVDAVNGTVLWSTTIDSVYASTPAVVNGVVYAGTYAGGVYALNAQTGTVLWTYSTNGSTVAPAVANGVVYAGSWDDNLYALNAVTGGLLWKYPTGGSVTCTPAVENGVVYLGSNSGALEALNAATGSRLWSFSSGACYGSSPTVANGVVYIGGNNSIYAVRADTGAPLWSYTTGNAILSSPTVADGVVYIGSWDEHVYAFGLPRNGSRETQDRPGLVALRPNLDLKVSRSNAAP